MSYLEIPKQKIIHRRYDLTRVGITRIVSKNLPDYSSKAEKIAFNDIFDNIPYEPDKTLSTAHVTLYGNRRMEMVLHRRDVKNDANEICGQFKFEREKDGLSIYIISPPDVWKFIRKVNPS
jgi:hypothetical protein